jgi:hypothetical protein
MSPTVVDKLFTPPKTVAPGAGITLLDTDTILDVVRVGGPKDLDIRDMIVDIEIERTMSGASTVTFTIHDPDRRLLRAPALSTALQILFDGYGFRMFAKKKSGPTLTLVFESKNISYLRHKKVLVRASRADVTRIQFCVRLARLVKATNIEIFAPEAARRFAHEDFSGSDQAKLAGRDSGLSNEDLPVGESDHATPAQRKVIQDVLDVGADLAAPKRILIAAVMTVIGESRAKNLKMATIKRPAGVDAQGHPVFTEVPTNAGSVGAFQQRFSQGWPASGNVKKDARAWYKGAGTNIGAIDFFSDNPDAQLWEICAAVQRPREDLRESTYDPWKKQATQWVDAYNPGQRGDEQTQVGKYVFSTKNDQGKIEDFWTTIKRLMDEVQMAAFEQQNRLWLVREAYLTSASMPVLKVDPDAPGIEDIDFDWNVNKEDATASIQAEVSRWSAPAGSCVQLMGLGLDDQKWLVETIGRSAFGTLAQIDLKTAQHALPEPAAKLVTISAGDRGGPGQTRIEGSDVYGLPDAIAAAYREAQKIDKKQYPYSWGGGHEHAGTPSRHAESSRGGRIVLGYDCSGSTGAVLAAAEPYVPNNKEGFGLPKKGESVSVSGDFGLFGVYGEGRYMTWWYSSNHVFLEFKRPANKDSDGKVQVEHFGTGRWGKSWGGAGFNSEIHPKDGFAPAHIPGM